MSRFDSETRQPEPFDETTVNILRGKSLVASPEHGREIRYLCRMIDWFCEKLDEEDGEAAWGENGWRVRFGVPEGDEG